jgi:peptide/nickel transport system permease protein
MLSFIARRLIYAVFLVLGAALVVFVLINIAPGDPVVALAGEDGDAQIYAQMRAKFGLDRPLPERIGLFLLNTVQGDLGFSWRYGRPAMGVIADHLPTTLLLVVPALVIATVLGVVLALASSARPGSWLDGLLNLLVMLGQATPGFWIAQIAVLVLAFGLDLLPVQGMTDARERYTGWAYVADVGEHMLLPVAVLSLQYLAPMARLARTGLLEALDTPYVRTARAKGASNTRALRVHALSNARLPLLTLLGEQIGFMLSGAVLIETVFAWPGLGRLLLSAMLSRDFAIITAMFVLIAALVALVNLITDVLYGVLDPRARQA